MKSAVIGARAAAAKTAAMPTTAYAPSGPVLPGSVFSKARPSNAPPAAPMNSSGANAPPDAPEPIVTEEANSLSTISTPSEAAVKSPAAKV